MNFHPAWDDQAGTTAWENYTDALLRQVAAKALKTRQKLSAADLRQRLAEWTENTPQVDRRLKEISPEARTLLSVVHLGKRQRWRVATLLEIASSLRGAGEAPVDGLRVVEELFLFGLLVPELPSRGKLASFEDWLGQGLTGEFRAQVSPVAARRSTSLDALPPWTTKPVEVVGHPLEADGLEWYLRLAALWQQLQDAPCRLTQQGGFFKRDQDRLLQDPLLHQPATDFLAPLPQAGHFLVSMALALGIAELDDLMLVAGRFPPTWQSTWTTAQEELLAVSSDLVTWSVDQGWLGLRGPTSPHSASFLLLLAGLCRAPAQHWWSVESLASWLTTIHPLWAPLDHPPDLVPAVEAMLLGWLFPLRLIQAAQTAEGTWAVRLSTWGRAILTAQIESNPHTEFPKTLLLQPNLEMIAYRQGLTPKLIASLTLIADWKLLSSACTLLITQSSVHRGLEAGLTFESMSSLLERHSVHPPPGNVLESIRTWAAKRDRVAVFQGVSLLEFLNRADRDAAVSRGLAGIPLGERYFLIEDEESLDFRHFRTLGTRDYALPPTVCVQVSSDGVTLTIDAAKADLLLESELSRFSTLMDADQERIYSITPATLAHARQHGISYRYLEDWFSQRTGQPIPAPVRLLWNERNGQAAIVQQSFVLRVPNEIYADGLWQWTETRRLLEDRIGPMAFIVSPEQLGELRKKLEEIGFPLHSQLILESKLSQDFSSQ